VSDVEAPEKPKRTWSPARRAAQSGRRSSPADTGRPDAQLVAEEVVGTAVDNLKGAAGMFIIPIAPLTGITICGVPAEGYEPGPADWQEQPKPGEWAVPSRADMMGRALLPQVARNPRLLALVDRFNQLFRNVELLEAAASIAAAAAVDAGAVPADASVTLPGGLQYPILEPVIGDVLEYMRSQQPQAMAVIVARQARRTESANGVTQPEEPYQAPPDEPTAAQRAHAAETRRRIAERDAVREANGGVEPTLRREGQIVLEGGVEDT